MYLEAGHTSLGEKGLNVSLQVNEAVTWRNEDDHGLELIDGRIESREILLTITIDTHKECINATIRDDYGNFTQMLHCILDGNQVLLSHRLSHQLVSQL